MSAASTCGELQIAAAMGAVVAAVDVSPDRPGEGLEGDGGAEAGADRDPDGDLAAEVKPRDQTKHGQGPVESVDHGVAPHDLAEMRDQHAGCIHHSIAGQFGVTACSASPAR